ncbi:hypothetical protein DL771_003972 [Monosporascus sp. 5C6A]|nr:hypothetical protein DL771_003972 [Monosporascus sp. 5C6A]
MAIVDRKKSKDRKWKLHKLILATRSKWFKTALCSNFVGAQCNEITIREMDPAVLDRAICWIYTQTLPHGVFENEATPYEACVNLSVAADYLLLDDLYKHSKCHLRENLHRKMIWFQKVFLASQDSKKQMGKTDIEAWFKGIQFAFKNNIKWAKAAFLEVPADAHYWMLPDGSSRLCTKPFLSSAWRC